MTPPTSGHLSFHAKKHKEFAGKERGGDVYLWRCVPVEVCTCGGMYLWRCVPLEICTCGGVYLWRCVPVEVCTCGCVYLWMCVLVRVCTCGSIIGVDDVIFIFNHLYTSLWSN